MPDTLNLYYARIANMGDLLNPLIIERCFGYRGRALLVSHRRPVRHRQRPGAV